MDDKNGDKEDGEEVVGIKVAKVTKMKLNWLALERKEEKREWKR